MTPSAGLTAALLGFASLAAATSAQAGDACRGPRTYLAHYKEQVCHRGVGGGYAACEWIDREHRVNLPAECVPRLTVEDAAPARHSAPLAGGIAARG
jgi:hypothetical protein